MNGKRKGICGILLFIAEQKHIHEKSLFDGNGVSVGDFPQYSLSNS